MSGLSQSYGRCLLDGQFFDKFYDRFTAASPEVAERFRNTNMDRQKAMMRLSLSMLVMFSEGKPIARPSLEQLRNTHGPGRYEIRGELYGLWLECLLETLRECDPKFDQGLDQQWREAMQKGIDFMSVSGGKQRAG